MAVDMTMTQASLRSRKYADARRALFKAAMELFREKGFDETSVDEIVDRAGFSRATFFNHFGNKSAVLRYYGEQLQERVHEMIESTSPNMPVLGRVKNALLAMAKDAQMHREELKLIFVHSIHDEAYLAFSSPAREYVVKMLARLIGEAQSQGQVRSDIRASELARQLLGLYNNAVLAIIFREQNAKVAVESMWKFAIGGMCGRDTVAE
jgi:TetR/AcrR family transcriptional regulator, cholesterol catabolism regulator